MKKILLIEDDTQVREMLEQVLVIEGYIVLTAKDGKDGMKKISNVALDMVITDIIMPEKDGIEVIIELKKSFPDIKIIAISGGKRIDSGTYLFLAKKLGANCIIEKPVMKKVLIEKIKMLFD